MCDRINMTDYGRTLFEIDQSHPIPKMQDSKPLSLPSILKENANHSRDHKISLNDLSHQLKQLQERKKVRGEGKFQSSIQVLEKQLLRDIGNQSKYLHNKAHQLASKLFSNAGDHEKHIMTEVSKKRNYLARINILHHRSTMAFERSQKIIRQHSNRKQHQDL